MELRIPSALVGASGVLPPISGRFEIPDALGEIDREQGRLVDLEDASDSTAELISGFLSVISYDGEDRLITGRRYIAKGDLRYVGAICHSARGYRLFRCDRIAAVYDATTGEHLGDGAFFERFRVDGGTKAAATFGLSASRAKLLVAGLNILAYVARCDGEWHPLEVSPIERFVFALWDLKGWTEELQLDAIMAHAMRLAPDSETFYRSLELYFRSRGSTELLMRSIGILIRADGIVAEQEVRLLNELTEFMAEVRDRADQMAEINGAEPAPPNVF